MEIYYSHDRCIQIVHPWPSGKALLAKIHITYDKIADAAYIYLHDPRTPVDFSHVYPCDPEAVGGVINLDFDKSGLLIGIEILRPKLPAYIFDLAGK